MDTNEIKKVYAFLSHSRNVTRKEIASGSGVSWEAVDVIMKALVAAGEVTRVGAEDNLATYSSKTFVPAPPPARLAQTEAEWSAEQRARGIAEYKKLHPEETAPQQTRTPEPTDAEVQRVIDAGAPKPLILSDDERKWLDRTRSLNPANPQEFLKR